MVINNNTHSPRIEVGQSFHFVQSVLSGETTRGTFGAPTRKGFSVRMLIFAFLTLFFGD